MTGPLFRAVDAHTGEVAAVPASLTTAQVLLEHLAAERDKAVQARDDARAEAENINRFLVEATSAQHRLAVELKHALDDRNTYMDRVDELERELAELKGGV